MASCFKIFSKNQQSATNAQKNLEMSKKISTGTPVLLNGTPTANTSEYFILEDHSTGGPEAQTMNDNNTGCTPQKVFKVFVITAGIVTCLGTAVWCGGCLTVVCCKSILASSLPANATITNFTCSPTMNCGCFQICYNSGMNMGNYCVN